MSTPSTHPDYMSIKSKNIDISAVVELDMLRKREFLNMSAERVKRGAFSIISRRLCPYHFRADDLNITCQKNFIAGGVCGFSSPRR